MQHFVHKITYTPIDWRNTIETWLHDEVNDNELGLISIDSIFPCDRDSFMGCNIKVGKGLVVVKNNLQCNRIPLHSYHIDQSFI